jgi:trimethylamine--corrinoid protein Co-methyltransferase
MMKSEYVYPKLGDRQTIEGWEAGGRVTIRERGLAALTQIMKEHYPRYVEPAHDARIRERFDIRLSPEDMQPGNGRW